jgi:hypothetical protein
VHSEEETAMTSKACMMGRLSGRLRLAVAGAVTLTALTTATSAAMAPPVQTSTPQMSRPDPGTASSARSGDPTRPRTQFPGFVLDRGRYRTIEAADPGAKGTEAVKLNNRGQIVGFYENPTFTPTPPATATPIGRLAWPPRR